jgi:phosphate:Na+ symporter
MEIYECILSLIAGVGVFILAMKLLSDSLNEIAGERMKTLLEKIAGNRIKGVLVGALVTGVIQSSSATIVMVIGFVNANVMDLKQAAAIIIGANIGTTVTGLLASLESLNISLYLSLLTFIGVMLAFVQSIKKIANLLVGLGMIFVGLKLMSDSCNDKSIKSSFEDVLKKINFPLLLELLGVIFTAIIQSSSAMTGIVIVMVQNKVMDMHNGLFITLGANVGTCVTAIIGIIGANINSKRTAVIHLTFNISGCLLFTPILWIFNKPILSILETIVSKEPMQIAVFHLFFNCTTALITTPLID